MGRGGEGSRGGISVWQSKGPYTPGRISYSSRCKQKYILFYIYIYIHKTITFDNSSLMIKKNNCANKQGLQVGGTWR